MRTSRRLSLLLAVLAALSSLPTARAQELKPTAVLLLDTSNSMEYKLGPDEVFPICYYPSGTTTDWCDNSTPDPTHNRSRFIVAQEVISGRFLDDEYFCCAVGRSAQEPDTQIPFHFIVPSDPPVRANAGQTNAVSQVQDGILDVFREDVRFALMTFDNNPSPNNGNAGAFSYGPTIIGWNSGAKNANSNRGVHEGYKTVARGSGALKPIASSEDPAVMAEQNDDLQDEVRWLFPFGHLSPLASFIDDARIYIKDDNTITHDECADYRPKGIILLTDGDADFEECYVPGTPPGSPSPTAIDYDNDGSSDDCNALSFDNKTYAYPWWYYQTSPIMAQKLFDETGFPTYVIGFNAGPQADTLLRNVAISGQTCADPADPACYYQASDEQQLRFSMEDIIQRLQAQGSDVRSRSRPVTSIRTSFSDTHSGYYEISSEISRVALRYQGHIERVTYTCGPDGHYVQANVEDFATHLAAQNPASRRLLTSTPTTQPDADLPTLDATCPQIPGCNPALLSFMRGGPTGSKPLLFDMYHGSPVLSIGPELDLPLPGYQAFRAAYGQRDSVLFAPTNGGVLHAFLMADIGRDSHLSEGQEIWAFTPRTIHDKLSLLPKNRIITIDNTPIIQDVRLYLDASQNPPERWATVLVGTLRGGGRGAFALDITDPYAPTFLWEINNENPGFELLGNTYAEPAIGSVLLQRADASTYETAVVVLPGGESSGTDLSEAQAVYVIELSTGRLLRTFTTLPDGSTLSQMTGSASPSGSVPGTLMTRAFMGDAQGRLLRLAFNASDPAAWSLSIFYDPAPSLAFTTLRPERATQAPAIAKDPDNNLIIVYGSGDYASLNPSPGIANFVASLTEDIAIDNQQVTVSAKENWFFTDPTPFKLSSAPLIFNNTVYFATITDDPADLCIGRAARLYAAHFTDPNIDGLPKPTLDLTGDGSIDFYSQYAPGTAIFGLDITVRPACIPDPEIPPIGGTPTSDVARLEAATVPKPQLVAQTGNPPFLAGQPPFDTTDTPVSALETVDKVRIDLPKPPQTLIPLSWGSIFD